MATEGSTNPVTPETLVEQLRAIRQQIPDYMQRPNASAATLRRAANINANFIQATINAIGASAAVQNALGKTADGLQQQADEAARWTAVEDELRAMLKGVIAANLTRRHRIGLTALQTYSISRQLVRQPEHSDLLPHLQEMKKLNRFGRRRVAPQTPAPPPAHT